MRVAFVTQWFPPEPGEVPWNMATALRDFGHDVHVLTGWPNYPSGRLATGYPRAPYSRSACQGMTIHRVAEIPGRKPTLPSRLINYASFAANATVATAVMPAMDVWLVYHSPATAALPAIAASVLSRLGRRPSAMAQVIQDLWPDSVTESEFLPTGTFQSATARALQRFCDASYAASDAIGVISPGMRSVLISRGVPAEKIYQTPNWTILSDVEARPISRQSLGLPDGRLLLYAGNLGQVQNLPRVAQLASEVPNVQVVFMGTGVAQEELRRLAAQSPNVHVKEPVPMSEVNKYLATADALLVSLNDSPLMRVTMPSKVQAALAIGRPVIAHAAGDVADLISETSSGLLLDPTDHDRAVASLRLFATVSSQTLAEWGAQARSTFFKRYSQPVGAASLDNLIKNAVQLSRQRKSNRSVRRSQH